MSSRRPRWHLIYFALAAFDLLAISISLGLNHHLANLYQDSIEMNTLWSARLDMVSDMASIASSANVAGNDVFGNHLADEQQALFDADVLRFHKKVQALENDLNNVSDHGRSHAESFTEPLTHTRLAMGAMESEAKDVFQMFREGDTQSAGARMAAFDRSYAGLNREMSSIRGQISTIINDHLIGQSQTASFIRKLEIGLGSMVTLMVIAIAFYGHHLSKAIRRMDDERELALHEVKKQKYALDMYSIVCITDIHGNITYANDKFCELSGYPREELIGQSHRIIKSDDYPQDFYHDLWETIFKGRRLA